MAKTKERSFRKLSNVEHVRLRTGMWLGQNSSATFLNHFFYQSKSGKYKIEHQELNDIPAKLKCLDEACMNCVDEYNKNLSDKSISKANKMTSMEVHIFEDKKRLSVSDDGRGIPVENAEGVFLHLMYGENFDDETKKDHVAGQNGVGISLVRIVSSYFKVEIHNNKNSYQKTFSITENFVKGLKLLKYKASEIESICQFFDEHGTINDCSILQNKHKEKLKSLCIKEGMTEKITQNKKKIHGTRITFELDPKYFNHLDVGFDLKYVKQYLQDIAMTNPGLKVIYRYKKEKIIYQFNKGMQEIFTNLEVPSYRFYWKNNDKKNPIIFESFFSSRQNDQNRSLSWINSNFASLGGSPIEYLENRICDEVRKKSQIIAYEKKLKTHATRNDVRNCFLMYNNWSILNPRFKSQDKSYLINDLNEPIRLAVDENLDKLIRKLDLINEVKNQMDKRTRIKAMEDANKNLKKANRNIIPKLIQCTHRGYLPGKTLFIAEGDSAIAGLRPARNPKIHALFPLRGKPLNVKGMAITKAIKNEEIKNIISIIDLPINEKVNNLNQLKYEKVSIITDADYDGYAIRSLIMSFFYEYWPELYKLGFVHFSSAPLYEVEAVNQNKEKKTFYCLDDKEYENLLRQCKKSRCNITRKKRNKGLGETSLAAMKYAVQNCITKIDIADKKEAAKTQRLWFDKDFAADRRFTISAYSKLFFDD